MLDIRFVRNNPEAVKQNIRNKFQDSKLPLVDEVIELDAKSREAQQEADSLRADRNRLSKLVGSLYAQGKREEAEEAKRQVAAGQERLAELEMAIAPEAELNEIARIVGLGALKYFILKVDPKKNMLFNPQESIDFNGNTGPFIQYTHARIKSVLRKAAAEGIVLPEQLDNSIETNEKETQLIQLLASYPNVVAQAGQEFSPSVIANYAYELSKEFNQFYHDYSFLKEENPAIRQMRLVLAANVAKTIKSAMSLLGIEVPERM